MGVAEIRVEELKQRLDAGENLFLLDVRDEFEFEISNIGGQLIPLAELSKRVNELDTNLKIVTVCKMGAAGRQGGSGSAESGFHPGMESGRRDSRVVGSCRSAGQKVLKIVETLSALVRGFGITPCASADAESEP
jgi:rhodanese-related sulfurtransferase